MSSCLGLYIENNLIKYAKVSKDHDNVKIDSYGIKFYDNIYDAIKQIVSETFSFRTPISVNLLDENYTYANLFSLLNKKDIDKAAKTEFEYFCNENGKNYNALEYRNILVPNLEDRDKLISIYSYVEKSSIASRLQLLSGYRVNNLSPLPLTITNLLKNNSKNKVIVNIEKDTSITYIIDGKTYRADKINRGMDQIFENIITKENSYAKAYEICKNTTIYTSQGRNLQIEENEYMEDIMPVLYSIVEEIKESIKNSQLDIQEIYITGLAAVINNIDLYFQENFPDKKCEILFPYFINKSNLKINIKDYLEVNSAISLGLQGVGIGVKEINFKKVSALEKLNQSIDIGNGPKKGKKSGNINSNTNILDKLKELFTSDFKKALDQIEINMIRTAVSLLAIILVYGAFSGFINKQISDKEQEINSYINESKAEVSKITNNTKLVTDRKAQYDDMIAQIDEANNRITESYAKKNALPNFLTEIMFNIPKEVQLLSIQNQTDKQVVILAQSKEYEQLGYFIAKIKNEGILTDVTSTSGEKQGDFVLVTITGNLPY